MEVELADKRVNDVLKFWSDHEATARTGKRAAMAVKAAGAAPEESADTLASAWDMIAPNVSDDYTLVDPFGRVFGKDELGMTVRNGAGVFLDHERNEHQVRFHGDAAVYVSQVTIKGELGGKDISGQYRETHMLLKREHGWQVVASHMTRIDPAQRQPRRPGSSGTSGPRGTVSSA
jgi:hypothetical protein